MWPLGSAKDAIRYRSLLSHHSKDLGCIPGGKRGFPKIGRRGTPSERRGEGELVVARSHIFNEWARVGGRLVGLLFFGRKGRASIEMPDRVDCSSWIQAGGSLRLKIAKNCVKEAAKL